MTFYDLFTAPYNNSTAEFGFVVDLLRVVANDLVVMRTLYIYLFIYFFIPSFIYSSIHLSTQIQYSKTTAESRTVRLGV